MYYNKRQIKILLKDFIRLYNDRNFNSTQEYIELAKEDLKIRRRQREITEKDEGYILYYLKIFVQLIEKEKLQHSTGTEILYKHKKEIFNKVNTYTRIMLSMYNQEKWREIGEFKTDTELVLTLVVDDLTSEEKANINFNIDKFINFVKDNNLEGLTGNKILKRYQEEIFKGIEERVRETICQYQVDDYKNMYEFICKQIRYFSKEFERRDITLQQYEYARECYFNLLDIMEKNQLENQSGQSILDKYEEEILQQEEKPVKIEEKRKGINVREIVKEIQEERKEEETRQQLQFTRHEMKIRNSIDFLINLYNQSEKNKGVEAFLGIVDNFLTQENTKRQIEEEDIEYIKSIINNFVRIIQSRNLTNLSGKEIRKLLKKQNIDIYDEYSNKKEGINQGEDEGEQDI